MSMQGKVVVITGANTGVGLETAVGVAAQGATTVLACRNQAKAEAAEHEVTQRTWNDDVHTVSLDLADLASVRKAADEILTRWDRLDVLDNNAGGTWSERQETAQGLEYTMGVCHIAHFYLTTPPARPSADDGAVPRHQHHLRRPPRRLQGHALRRPPEREGLRRDGGLLPRQAGQRVVHPRTGSRAAGSRSDGEHGAPRLGAEPLRHGRRHHGQERLRLPGRAAVPDQPRTGAKTSVYLATSPDVATRTGEYWVRSKRGHMGKHARDAAAQRRGTRSERLLASVGYAVT